MMDLIVSWLCTAIAAAFQGFTKFFTSIFGFDPIEFAQTFSYAGDAYGTIRSIGLALALVLAGWQILTFFLKGSEASVSPIRACLNAVIAVAFIFYGNYLMDIVLDLCQYPFDALNNIGGVEAGGHFNSIGEVLVSYVSDAFAGSSMLLYLIMLILIIFSFVKLLLEIVERYVVTFVLIYLSPLASATLASSSTSGIYKKFIAMFFSQCLLLLLNVWCLRMACSGLSLSGYEGSGLIVPLLLCYAFLRVSAKMDSYINQLGLNAAITGNGLGAEIMATGMSLMGMGKSGHGGSADGAGNKVLGAAKAVQTYANRYNPAAAIGKSIADRAVGANAGFSEAYRTGGSVIAGAKSGWQEGGRNSDNLHANHSKLRNAQIEQFVKDEGTPSELAANLSAIGSNEHMAHQAFSYLQENKATLDKPIDDKDRVAAVIKGLGVARTSKEAGEFVKAGFGSGIENISGEQFAMDGNGIRGEFDSADGYRHKLSIHNQSQFDKLNIAAREGYEQHTLSDGHRYYVKATKTKRDSPEPKTKDGKKPTPTENDS